MTEAFPNAEYAFLDPFNHPDPVPKLLELIMAHPDVPTILDLVVLVYMELVGESLPSSTNLQEQLFELRNSKGITAAGGDKLGKSSTA